MLKESKKMNVKPVIAALFAACLVNPFVVTLAAKPDKPTPQEPTVSGVAVVDSTGKLMGKFLGGGGVMLTVGGATYGLSLQGFQDSNGVIDNTKMQFSTSSRFYRSTDCTGEAYAYLIAPSLGVNQAVIINDEDGRTLLFPARPTDMEYISAGSQLTVPSSEPFTCVTYSDQRYVVLLQSPIDITGQFTPPFTIK